MGAKLFFYFVIEDGEGFVRSPEEMLRESGRRAGDRHLEADDILLVVEVADSSLRYDRIEKMPRYAGAGIPEAWLVDVAGGAVTVSTGPGPDGYADRRVFRRGEEIASTAVAGLRVTVDEVVGRGGDRRG